MTRYLVTGAAGFIGSNFVRMLLERAPDAAVTNLDALTYAGVPATVAELDADPRHTFVHGDVRDANLLSEVVPGHDVVVHFAAESFVDRSIRGPQVFLDTNVLGTACLLEAARAAAVQRFVHVSTDEVYGSVSSGFADEAHALAPSSPYSASKAASDLLALSYCVTYDFPVFVTRCTNNYGPYQFPEKVIPLFITNLLDGGSVPLYGDGRNERDWLHVDDHCSALVTLLEHGEPGRVYNIGASNQVTNLELTRSLLTVLGLPESRIQKVPDRPGHDFRYAIDSSRVRELGWKPEVDLTTGLERTIAWYRDNEPWWRPLKER